ncbi:hypothetical protein VNI00_013890 [Paramarasmius palmivorus]|uniref:Protein kinase domain-containing protein n=1 Tax=Paramarasmius palmivorus TaxID=297713 RepID=A0AAW0BVE7_9AGAR
MASSTVRLKCYFFTHREVTKHFVITTASDEDLNTLARHIKDETDIGSKPHITLYKATDLHADPEDDVYARVKAWLVQNLEDPLDPVRSGLVGKVGRRAVIGPILPNSMWSRWMRQPILVRIGPLPSSSDFRSQTFAELATIRALPSSLRARFPLLNKHDREISRFSAAPSPSAGAENPSICYKGLVDVRAGRPAAIYGPSNALFDPHLARLTHELRNLDTVPVTPEMINLAYALLTKSADFYENERAKESAIRPLLGVLFPGGLWQLPIANSRAKPGAFRLLGLIFELKNEDGNAGDPEAQAILDYVKLLSDEELTGQFRRYSNCPSILLALAGSRLNVSTAIFTDAIYVEKLYSESLHGSSSDFDNRLLRLARALQAVKTAFDKLTVFYRSRVESPLDGTHLFPRPVQADRPHAEVSDSLGLRFLHKLSLVGGEIGDSQVDRHLNTSHAVYVALSNGSSIPAGQVVVKFAQRYNVEAHQLLANAGLAPQLYHRCPVLGGYTMIVMERMAGKQAWLWRREGGARLMPHGVYKDVERAITLLHDHDIVFGDLRLPNIIVQDDNSGVLIDFDWAAKAGEGRYPASILVGSFEHGWASGVERYGLMEKVHDLHMLRKLKEVCEQP